MDNKNGIQSIGIGLNLDHIPANDEVGMIGFITRQF